ncbi:MAG: hypothetical protein ACREL5_06860 [Gemmatimonadales bacterium]
MSPPGEREFRLPGRRRVPWWIWALAVALHIAVVLLLMTARGTPALARPEAAAISDSPRAMVLGAPLRRPRAASRPASIAPPSQVEPESDAVAVLVPRVAVDTPPHGAADLRPHYGDGRLWVEPLPEAPRQIARRLTGKTDAELADSAVTAMVQTYLDEMAAEHQANPEALPSWTTKIAGKTVGIDQRWIYLGPLKVPTALLALLPIRMQANPTEAEYNAKLQQMRADLYEAARRAETYDEFKDALKALREQTEYRREFEKNQRIPPDTSHHP